MSQLSDNIKYLRVTAGATQKDFGKAFGVTRDNIASYERGSAPKIDFLKKVVNFYHMSLDELVNSNLKSKCEDEKSDHNQTKIAGNSAGNSAGNLEKIAGIVTDKEKIDEDIVTYKTINTQIFNSLLKDAKELSAENAILKRENVELKAENANLRAKLGGKKDKLSNAV